MEWKNHFRKTPILIIFIIVISFGIGTASAGIVLPNIILAGNVLVDGSGAGTPDAAFHVIGSGSDHTPNQQGIQITGSDASDSPAIEITGDGEPPYIDFQNDITGTDFDGRIILTGDDKIEIQGADLECPNCILGFYRVSVSSTSDGGTESRTATCDQGDMITGGGFSSPVNFPRSPDVARAISAQSYNVFWSDSVSGFAYQSQAICADYPPAHNP